MRPLPVEVVTTRTIYTERGTFYCRYCVSTPLSWKDGYGLGGGQRHGSSLHRDDNNHAVAIDAGC